MKTLAIGTEAGDFSEEVTTLLTNNGITLEPRAIAELGAFIYSYEQRGAVIDPADISSVSAVAGEFLFAKAQGLER